MARDEGNSGRSAEHRSSEHRESYVSANRQALRLPVSGTMLTTGALIGVTALLEPELLVGMAVGAGIATVSNWFPDLVGGTVRPLVKTAIKAGYAAAVMAREMVSEASETMSDVVAEARAESGNPQ
ncbi:MAG: DUF5132 domain-containing protein [Deltaproteobacteria bacterium]|nr:DUF5132 domain-containing protein [Deltaproteobacteria bacterium]